MVVVFQVGIDAETCAKRCGEQAAASGGTDECEGAEIELDGTSAGAFIYHYINAIVFHGRVEVFFDHATQAVDFVDKQYVVFFQGCEDAGKVAGLVEHRAGGDFKSHSEFVGHDAGEGGLAQSGRAVEEDMVEGFVAHTSGGHKYAKVFHNLFLPAERLKRAGAERFFEVAVLILT